MSTDHSVTNPPLMQSAKIAFAASVHAFGGQDAAALETGKSQGRICAYGLPNTDAFPTLDVIITLEQRTHGTGGHPHVTRWLAAQVGFGLVALPDPGRREPEWHTYSCRLMTELGELLEGLGKALADDNDVRAREARNLIPEAGDMVRVAVELEAALKARAGEIE
jgi:hypothetical protein